MSPEVAIYYRDVLFIIVELEESFSKALSFGQFAGDANLIRATERRLLIIGEALSNARQLGGGTGITDLNKTIRMRNRLAHDYDMISPEQLFTVVKKNIPVLKLEVEGLLGRR